MPGRTPRAALVTIVVGLAVATLAGCRGEDRPEVVNVPRDAKTIRAAIEAAHPGDLVLVQPGVYREEVEIDKPRITLRGIDRNEVVIDGEFTRPNGVVVTGEGSAVQNLTVRNALLNGVVVRSEGEGGQTAGGGYGALDPPPDRPLRGFLVDHVTAYNNGLYGIYAFNARQGTIQSSYASGMADAGIYVGRCKPCDVVVRGNVAERNAVGYEAVNASGPLYVYGNRFTGNRVGVTTNSHRLEAFVPQEDAHITGNVIGANNQELAPAQAEGGFGIGLGIAGGTRNTVARNLVVANRTAGVVLASEGDLAPVGNRVIGNAFTANGVDVVYATTPAAPGSGNCLEGNALASVLPPSLPTTCQGSVGAPSGVPLPATAAPPGIASRDVQPPPPLRNLPDAATAPPPTTSGLPGPVDLSAVGVPEADLLADQSTIRW
ncbi:MAG TPA: right-handed parallel beta-helix repeat-containing protein [Acidimicrobiales bacterium]